MATRFRCITLFGALAVAALPALPSNFYHETDLVSDLPGAANPPDPSLVNPWGLSSSTTSPWWVSDNGTGVSTLYTGTGAKINLTVTIPPPAGGTPPSAPTGQVFNSTTDFKVAGTKASFIFATEDGTISAWNGGPAVLEVDKSATGAVYKGLALGNNGTANFLYAANFNSGKIDVFDKNFASTTLAGNFTDPNIPAGYAPFNVENLNNQLYVTYAKQDAAKHDDVAGLGNGYVDVFDLNGNLIKRLTSNGPLDSPWGLAIAPANFGTYSNDLLVGNFGDGTVNAFDILSGNSLGTLTDANGNPISIEGLWGLAFGNGASAGATNALYFTAGISGGATVESHGLFGDLTFVPEPGAVMLTVVGLGALVAMRRRAKEVKPI